VIVNCRSTSGMAGDLFRELGYQACRELREDLKLQMLEHRKQISELRIKSVLVRSRSSRNPTIGQKAAKLMGGSERSITRDAFVRLRAPDLDFLVRAGEISLWAAYGQASLRRDMALVAFFMDANDRP